MDIENDDDNQEVEMTPVEQETPHSQPIDAESIIDLVADGKATEAREAIYAALYNKVGERIDSLRPDIRSEMIPTQSDEEPVDLEADVDDSQE